MKTEFGMEGARTWKEERKVKLDCSAKFQLKVLGKSLGPGGDFDKCLWSLTFSGRERG